MRQGSQVTNYKSKSTSACKITPKTLNYDIFVFFWSQHMRIALSTNGIWPSPVVDKMQMRRISLNVAVADDDDNFTDCCYY